MVNLGQDLYVKVPLGTVVKDLETGKYKIKKGVITFTPDSKDGQDKMLYIKDDHLCEDPDCTKIFAASNESCGTD